jgi:protein-disulfide isomerase
MYQRWTVPVRGGRGTRDRRAEGPGRRRGAVSRAAAAIAVLLAVGAPATAGAQAATGSGQDGARERALESRAKGPDEAAVRVFEIADFQCPYCAQFSRTVAPELDARYVKTGRVQWIFVNMPLHTHEHAWLAAEAALCAGLAGDRFWAMHDRLFEKQEEWGGASNPAALFLEYARSFDVPEAPYRACVASDQIASLILQDVTSVVSAGITGTPTFIVMKDGEVVNQVRGVQSVEEWSRVLDEALR